MKNLLIIILFSIGIIFGSCTKSNPQPLPTCEEGGVEVTP